MTEEHPERMWREGYLNAIEDIVRLLDLRCSDAEDDEWCNLLCNTGSQKRAIATEALQWFERQLNQSRWREE